MSTIAIVQARMSSTRLPGKVLMPLAGHAMLEYVVRRCQLSQLDGVVVATTEEAADDPIAEAAGWLGVGVYRGSRDDVLSRYVGAAEVFGADPVVRITSDCPLIDSGVIDAVLNRHRQTAAEFVYTAGWPRGLGDVELMTLDALCKARDHTTPDETQYREHVTTYHLSHVDEFATEVVNAPKSIRRNTARLCVDEPRDMDVVSAICEYFAPRMDFNSHDVLMFLADRPRLQTLNQGVVQKDWKAQ